MATFFLTLILVFSSCNHQDISNAQHISNEVTSYEPRPGAYNLASYLSDIEHKKVGLVVNHTSMIDNVHLVDTLLTLGIDIKMIFAPEHGFKGTAYNGEEIKDGLYKGSIPIRSLYGKLKKPSAEDLSKVDVVLFDIQDVGARFYTYISTLHYVMEAGAENDTDIIILDRPNPNAHYVDGPVLKKEFTSFVGLHPVPVVYGMTIGEYGLMINGEGWLSNKLTCHLKVVEVTGGYNHRSAYELPIPPSPNLPNYRSILLYPSLCFLEGTVISAGRGTDQQFQIYGHPSMSGDYQFTPESMASSKYPKHEGKKCNGQNLQHLDPKDIHSWKGLNLEYLLTSYQNTILKDESFFLKSNFFNKLAGNSELITQIKSGWSADQIKDSWIEDLQEFKSIRSKYLIYPD